MRNANENSAISADAGAARSPSQAPFNCFRPAVCGLSLVSALLGTAGMAAAQEAPPPAMPPADMMMMMMPAPMTPISTPAIAGPLSYPLMPFSLDLGPLGDKIYVDGAISGLAFSQTPASRIGSDSASRVDIDNGQIFVQKVDGLIQFFVQGGIYSIPALGTPYLNSHQTEALTFGFVPQGFIKLAPADNFSVEVGKLPTLVGDEYTFTFENMNIFRGLLWNQEQAVSRGVQANYTAGPVAFAISLNDGYYSNRYNWLSGSAAWTIDMENSISFVGAGNFGRTGYATTANTIDLNNSSIFNIIYTHTDGPWVISPYVQVSSVGANHAIGILQSASTTGVALLASYGFNDFLKLAGRIEYISSSGKGTTLANSTNLLYGPNSNAFSFTITPTFQTGIFFARAEYSYVSAGSTTAGFAFGPNGTGTSQSRFALEAGVLF
jgi:putative OmpL-like beta-barrel porin-2